MLLARSNILRQILRRTCYPTMFPRGIRNLFIQTMETPSEQALKFLPSVQILKENETREFLSGREAACSPLALKLFSIDGIKTIMFGSNFITVEKANDEIDWSVLKPEIFSILTEYLTNGSPIINEESELSLDVEINEEDDEIVAMIKELIFTRIKPAIQEDGGDIEFVKFIEENGTVFLKLKGACRSCDSSTVTLKNGIESMLKFYIEEVETVEQISEDDTTEITEQFQKEDLHLTPRARGDPPNL